MLLLATELPSAEGPLIVEVTCSTCLFKWSRPSVDKNVELRYKIEQQIVDKDNEWSPAFNDITDTSCLVDGLQPGTWYILQVVAVHKECESNPIKSERFRTKSKLNIKYNQVYN